MGGELTITLELRYAGTLGAWATELELPGRAIAIGNLLRAACLGIGQRNLLVFYLLRREADTHPLTTKGDALLGEHLFHGRALLGRHHLQLSEHDLQVGHLLAVNLHIARRQLPQAGLQNLRLGEGRSQTNHQPQYALFHVGVPFCAEADEVWPAFIAAGR